jgi:hypothetical protein
MMALESETFETLEATALQLRLRIEQDLSIDRSIATLDADPEVEEAWAAQVDRRQLEIENGTVSLVLGPETLANLKAEFR